MLKVMIRLVNNKEFFLKIKTEILKKNLSNLLVPWDKEWKRNCKIVLIMLDLAYKLLILQTKICKTIILPHIILDLENNHKQEVVYLPNLN
jgi:hypothetical protein